MRNGKYTLVVSPDGYPGKRYRGRYAYEHHVVWWRHTGKALEPGYCIHHKNEDTRDNRFENLELLSVEAHNKHHGLLARKPDVPATCGYCSKVFFVSPKKLRERSARTQTGEIFCSYSCAAKAQFKRAPKSKPAHGVRGRYSNHGCRCELCSKAQAEHMKAYYAKRARD